MEARAIWAVLMSLFCHNGVNFRKGSRTQVKETKQAALGRKGQTFLPIFNHREVKKGQYER